MIQPRPILAFAAAAALASALGAGLTLGLVYAFGYWEWPFLGWAGLWLFGTGLLVALAGGGTIALLAVGLARIVRPPRPLADMLAGAIGALALLLALRMALFAAAGEGAISFLPDAFGPVLLMPPIAGAVCGLCYWRFAGQPKAAADDE